MEVKDLIMKLIYCNPDKEIRGLFYEFQEEKAVEHELNLQRIDEFDNDIELIFEDLKLLFNKPNTYSFESLKELVLDWAKGKDLIHDENADKQFMKFVEEVFEFKTEMDILYNYRKYYRDRGIGIPSNHRAEHERITKKAIVEMGDILVTLIILCEQLHLDPIECLDLAYKKISKRKGKTIDGVFVKEEDLK